MQLFTESFDVGASTFPYICRQRGYVCCVPTSYDAQKLIKMTVCLSEREWCLAWKGLVSWTSKMLPKTAVANHGTGQGQLLDDWPHTGWGQQMCIQTQKEAKGQLTAQATAKVYYASVWLPGQGNELRLMPYPILLHTPTVGNHQRLQGWNILGSLFLMPHRQDMYFLTFAPILPVCCNG